MVQKVGDIIKREIEFMFGRQIVSSGDCIQLSDEIFRITKSRLNANTLRRFFGLVKTSYLPSSSTIQILCNYCGFLSANDIQQHSETKVRESESPDQKELLKYLVSLFRETPVDNKNNEIFKSIVRQTIFFLDEHHWLIDHFQLLVARTKNGQDYYYEGFVHIDKLNSYYGNGLRYYLNEKEDPGAQIFGYSLLVFKGWLTENMPEIDRNFQKLALLPLNGKLSCNVSGRYFASHLYYENAKDLSSGNTIMKIDEHNIALADMDPLVQVNFETTVAEALVLTGNLEEGLFYCSAALKKTLQMEGFDESLLQHLYLLQVLAMSKMGDEVNAGYYYRRIRPTDFSFLNKKLLTSLYGYLTKRLKKKMNYSENYSEELVSEMGFSRLRKLLSCESNFERSGNPG